MTACTLERAAMPVGVEGRLAAFGELVATAISNGAARAQLEQVAAEQAALRRGATLVARAGEPSAEVFGAVAEEVSFLFGATVVGLVRYEADGIATTIGATRALACRGRSSRWGAVVLGLDSGSPPLPADTLERLTAFTDLVGTDIANAEGRTAIAQLAEEQAAVRRIATLVARGGPPDGVLSAVAAEIVRVVGIAIGHVVRFERDATATVVAASEGAGLWPVGSSWPLDADSVVGAVHRTGAPARVDATGATGRIGRWASVGAPVVIGDAVWGAAVVSSQAGPLPVPRRAAWRASPS